MDTILHSVQGGLLTSFATNDPQLIALGSFVGALPDIIGFAEKIIKKDYSVWNWYIFSHKIALSNPFVFFPQSLIHILQDYPLHKKNCKWWIGSCTFLWIFNWLLTLLIIGVSYYA